MAKRISIQDALRMIQASGAGGPLAGQQSPEGVLAWALEAERKQGKPLDQKVDEAVLTRVIMDHSNQLRDDTVVWWAQPAQVRSDATKRWAKDPGLTPGGALLLLGVLGGAAVAGAAVTGGLAATGGATAAAAGSSTAGTVATGTGAASIVSRAAMVRQAWSLASTAQKVKFTAGAAGILGLTAATFDPVTNGDAQAPGSTPPSNTDDEEDDATSITMDEAIETGQSLQVTTADGTPVGDFGTEDIARLDDDEAGTLTAADLAYGASFGVNPMEQGDIIEQLGGIDKASVYWDKPSFEEGLRNGDLRSDSFSGYVTSGAPHARYKQRYSYREAINMPMELSNAEIQAWGEKLWEAGFMEANVDLTKPFSEQWVGDRYDPAFQRAWQNMLRTSLMNPEKSAKAILEERRKLRRPLIDKARQEAIDEKVKSTLRSMRLPDPAGINQTVEDQMQERLGRNPTGAETEAIRNQVVGAISEQAKRVLGEEQVSTDIDIAARAEQAIEAMNPVEVLGHDTADAFDMFRSMLGPGGRNG